MPVTVDTDYTAYVVFGYSVGVIGLLGVTIWTVLRLVNAQRKLEQAESEPSLFADEATLELTSIIEWSKACQDGCRSDLSFTPRGSTWEEVCCEADQCSRSR